jgi:hypothetical protein
MQSIVGRVDNIVPALKGWRGASGVMTGGVSHFCRSDWERRRNFGAVGSNHDVAPTRGMTSLKLEARQDPLAAALNGNCSYGCSAFGDQMRVVRVGCCGAILLSRRFP